MQHGFQLSRPNQSEQRQNVVAHPAVGAEDIELESPDIANVFRRIIARSRPASQQSPAAAQDLEGFRPTIATAEVDDDVHPTAVLATEYPRPAEPAAALGDPIGIGVVAADVAADRLQMLELRLA